MQHVALIVSLLIEGSRAKRGVKWCKEYGVGYARRKLGTPVQAMTAGSEAQTAFTEEQRAAEELRTICRKCGGCRWSEE
jgi:Na+/proline symporter